MPEPTSALPLEARKPLPDSKPRPEPDGAVPVRTAEGILLAGWPIRRDTVLVHAGGLSGPVTVTIDGREVQATATHESTRGIDSWQPLTALELPENSLEIRGERFPPDMADEEPRFGHGARRAFWCIVFPRMRGC